MRRIASLASAVAVLLAVPAAAAAKVAAAPAAAPAASGGGGFQLKDVSISGFIGGEFGDLDGLYLRADASAPIMPLTPKINLLGVVSLGYNHFGADVPFGTISWNLAKLLASARFQMELAPKLEAYADGGLGFYFGGWKSETTVTLPGLAPITQKASDTTGGFTMRFAVGGSYEIDPRLKLGAELGFNPYFGDAETTNFFIGVGAAYKL